MLVLDKETVKLKKWILRFPVKWNVASHHLNFILFRKLILVCVQCRAGHVRFVAMKDYRRGAHTTFEIHLYLVWVTRYRKPVMTGEVGTRPGRRWN